MNLNVRLSYNITFRGGHAGLDFLVFASDSFGSKQLLGLFVIATSLVNDEIYNLPEKVNFQPLLKLKLRISMV